MDKTSAGFTKNERQRTQINKSRIERGGVTTDTTEICRIIRDHYEKLHTNKLDNLEKWISFFLETHSLPKPNYE